MLSDSGWELANELDLSTFTIEGGDYLKRSSSVVADGRIEHVFYPAFPPDEHANEVLKWVKETPSADSSD